MSTLGTQAARVALILSVSYSRWQTSIAFLSKKIEIIAIRSLYFSMTFRESLDSLPSTYCSAIVAGSSILPTVFRCSKILHRLVTLYGLISSIMLKNLAVCRYNTSLNYAYSTHGIAFDLHSSLHSGCDTVYTYAVYDCALCTHQCYRYSLIT